MSATAVERLQYCTPQGDSKDWYKVLHIGDGSGGNPAWHEDHLSATHLGYLALRLSLLMIGAVSACCNKQKFITELITATWPHGH